jgi:hypothetical protein
MILPPGIATMIAGQKGKRAAWSLKKRLLSLSFKVLVSALLLYAVLQKAGLVNV